MDILFKIYIINKYSSQSDSDLQPTLRPININLCFSDLNVHSNHHRILLKCRFGLSGSRVRAPGSAFWISFQGTPMLLAPGPGFECEGVQILY